MKSYLQQQKAECYDAEHFVCVAQRLMLIWVHVGAGTAARQRATVARYSSR